MDQAFNEVFTGAPAMIFSSVARSEIEKLERNWWRERVRETFESANATIPAQNFEGVFNQLWEHFEQPTTWRISDNLRKTLTSIRKEGFYLAILSNFDQRLLTIIQGLGIADIFDAVVLPASAGALKPSPEIFRYCLELLDLEPSQAIYVGDDIVNDIEGARGAGIEAINVTDLATLEELLRRIRQRP